MSYTALIPFIDGKPQAGVEFRNAWGGAARIWTSLFDTYVPKKHQYDSWVTNPHDTRLWDLAKRSDLPTFERATHAFTFDRFYVRREHFVRLASDLREFAQKYRYEGQKDHLPAWAQWLDEHGTVEAVGLHCTSVSSNPWHRAKTCEHCGHESEETEPVPLNDGTEVYDWLDSLKEGGK